MTIDRFYKVKISNHQYSAAVTFLSLEVELTIEYFSEILVTDCKYDESEVAFFWVLRINAVRGVNVRSK